MQMNIQRGRPLACVGVLTPKATIFSKPTQTRIAFSRRSGVNLDLLRLTILHSMGFHYNEFISIHFIVLYYI